jgi:hypothetical protein
MQAQTTLMQAATLGDYHCSGPYVVLHFVAHSKSRRPTAGRLTAFCVVIFQLPDASGSHLKPEDTDAL